eukprot:10706794-Ditylum_brightwellii.AAC.1
MGHPQPKMPLVTDNSTTHGLTQSTMIPKRSKAMDMRCPWLKDRQCQGQFDIQWRHGTANKADYPSKHHPPKVHQQRRPQYLMNSVEHKNCELASAIKE